MSSEKTINMQNITLSFYMFLQQLYVISCIKKKATGIANCSAQLLKCIVILSVSVFSVLFVSHHGTWDFLYG